MDNKKKVESEAENASEQVRVYPSDYKFLKAEADRRRTLIAQVVHEALEEWQEPKL